MSSIDGLVSGLNTSTIIAQLMQVERQPEQALVSSRTSAQSMVKTLQGLNSAFSKMQTAAAAFSPASVLDPTAWDAHTATTSDTSIATATAGSKALSGGITFAVTSVASSGSAVSAGTVSSTSAPVVDGPFTLTKGTTDTTINVAAGASLADVVTAINKSGAGVTAAAVQVAPGSYRLQMTSTTTGSATDISVAAGTFPAATSSLGDMSALSMGADTVLRVGTGPGAYDVTSPSRTVSNLLPDVTIDVAKAAPGTQVSLTVGSDTASMTAKMSALVDAANAALSYIDVNSQYDPGTKTAGSLLGNSLAGNLNRGVTSAVIGTSQKTPALFGVSVTRDGEIAFDKSAFAAAYAKDPDATKAALTAMTARLVEVGKQASDPSKGQITAQITTYNDNIKNITTRIAAFEERMTLKQQALQRQYSNLEVALGKLQSQSSWLTGQLASLPKNSSNN
jgi:flagellar hook-associated protein 2